MKTSDLRLGKKLGLGLICSAAVLMTACGGSSSSNTSTSTNSSTPAPTASPTAEPTAAPTAEPTAEPTTEPTEEPSDGKVSGPLDPVQDAVVTAVIVDTIAPELPEPLDAVAVCAANAINTLVDVPDAAINLAQAGPNADPMVLAGQIQTSVETFINQMTNLAFALNGDGSCDEDHPQNPFAGNPFAGTPLELFVAELSDVADALDTYADLENPELTDLTGGVDFSQVAAQLAILPVSNLPVVGDVFGTLVNALTGVDGSLGNIGALDDAATSADVTALVDQLLQDVLTAVVPVAGADTANNFTLALGEDPADVAGTVAALLATLSGNYGDELESVIPANFATLLNSVSSPSAASFADLLGGSNPLAGVLAELAGGGVDDADLEMLTALLLANDAGLPVAALTAALGGNTTDASPIEVLSELDGLVGNAAVDTLIEAIKLESLIAQVPVISAIATIIDENIFDLLDIDLGDFLDNLLDL